MNCIFMKTPFSLLCWNDNTIFTTLQKYELHFHNIEDFTQSAALKKLEAKFKIQQEPEQQEQEE